MDYVQLMQLMKKLLLFAFSALLFTSCDNELDLIEDWKDIPIVYALLDPADTAHYIRVEKVFVDDEISGFELAGNPDSFYYENITVQLIKGNNQVYSLEKVDGSLEGYPRDNGAFANFPNYLYKIKSNDLQLVGDETMTLKLLREGLEDVSSSIQTVGPYNFVRPRPDDPELLNLNYANHVTIRWVEAENAVDYEVYILAHYEEKFKGEPDANFVPRTVRWKAAGGVESTSVILESKEFFTFLGSTIPVEDDKVRQFKHFEFRVIAVGQELSDYIAIGGANLGITASQEIPQYSNLSEGLGVFSSKWEISIDNLRVIEPTLDSIIGGVFTKHLNFER